MTAKRMRLLTAGLAIIALIAALFVINPGLGRSASAAWDGTAAESFEGGNGDSSDPYIIKTAEQLAFLAKQVNGGETYHGKHFQLEADLDLSGSEWSPIGIGERETDGSTVTKPFAGTFDGKNHKISGLTLTAGLDDQGLFGCSSGTIGNLGIVRGNISVGSAERIGAICGYSTGTIENCWNSADITGSTEGGKYVGGICGYSTGTIYGCLNMGDITANSFIGGICGNTAQSTQISNCFNSGSITGKEQIGGIAGINLNYITYCINAGELTGEESVYAVSHSDDVRNIYASISYSFYNSDVFSPSSGDKEVTGIPTGALCGSILNKYNFYKNLWESGSITLDGSGKAQMTYVRLKNIPAAPAAMERKVFNFGTESDPDWDTYTLITEAQQFVDIGADKAKWNQNYVLGNDIDLESRTDVKIIENYYGKFSGNGHSIKNVYINEPEKSQVALFGEVNSGSVIRDLTLDGGSIYGKESVAGIAVVNNGSLINCTNSCSVSGDIGDIGFIGGVCAYSKGTLISCRNTGSVSCTAGTHDEGRTTGGVCGYSYGKISGCYNSGTVESPKQAGGVCGSSSDGEIKNCYNSGAVSGVRNVGGICGESQTPVIDGINIGTVTGTENVGAICGSENDNVKNCWYNSDTSGARGIAGADLEGAAKGLTTLQMTSADALTTMGLNSTLWTKKANDKAAGIAYYPSLREDGAPSIGYKSGVILENSSADSLAYLGTADFTVYSLVEFDGVPQAYSDTALTAGSGSFTVTLNDKEVAAAALPDGAKTKVTTSALPAAGDDCRFVLNYSGAGSSFIDDTSADCTVKVEKLALTAADLEFAPPSDLKYNGAPKEAEITVKPGISGAGAVTLKYYRDGNEADPVIPGTYTVTADIAEGDNCKAAVLSGGWEFTIVKGDITADLFTFTAPEDCRYNGKEKPVSVTVNDGAEGVGKITLHYFSSTSGEIAVPVKPETIKVLIDVAEGEYYNAASNIGGWLYTIYYGTPVADDFIFHAPADTEYTGLPLAAAVEARRFSDGSETGMGEITAVKYYLDGAPADPTAPGTYTVKIDVAKGECYLAASDVTSPDWTFTITPAALTASGSGTASGTFGGSLGSLSVSGLKAMLGTDEIPGRWALSGGEIPNVGDTGMYTAEFTADVHPEYYMPLTAEVTLDIAKAQAPAMADTTLSCYWGASGEKSVSLAGLPENTGEIYPATIAVSDVNGILAADSARYSDGKLYFTLGENTEESIGNTAEITVTLPTQNYTDFTFRITVTLAAKGDQQAPAQSDFRLELTSSGSDITAEIVTELSGVEFSFDGSDWGAENAAAVGHDEFVTGYIRFAETDILNPSPAASLTLRSGHGELTHHGRSEPNCISEGNTEYWECGLCARYFLDEAGTQETALKNVVLAKTGHTPGEAVRENEIPATCTVDGSYDEVTYCTVCSEKYSTEHKTIPAAGHRWSVKYESDKSGHWHVCEVCDTASDIEDHVSGGAATYAKPELCTVCGYEMSPRKTSTGGNSSGGTARPSRPAAATETRPGINGVQKSWTDIAADLMKQGGGSAVISLNGETTVPADVIKAIADSRIKAEFIIDSIKSWIIDGAAIKSASAADFTVLPGNSDRSGLRGVFGADLKISGTGIPAELKLTFRREFAGQFANVYRLTDGGLEFRCCTRISVDGTAAIPGAYTGGEYVVMVCEYSDLPGDFSNDGIMNALDAAMILKDIVGFSRGENPRMADFNSDGAMNALDASAILRAIVAE